MSRVWCFSALVLVIMHPGFLFEIADLVMCLFDHAGLVLTLYHHNCTDVLSLLILVTNNLARSIHSLNHSSRVSRRSCFRTFQSSKERPKRITSNRSQWTSSLPRISHIVLISILEVLPLRTRFLVFWLCFRCVLIFGE